MAEAKKRYTPKKVKESIELFEMPKEINATEFNLDDERVNRKVALDFVHHGEKLEEISS